MRIFKTSSFGWIGGFIFLAAIVVSGDLFGQDGNPSETAQGDDAPMTSFDKGTTSEEEVPTVGIGKFFKLPFHVTVHVRAGYDDNVLSQPDEARQGSAFVEPVLGISYIFGNTRTQLDLHSEIRFTQYFEDIPQVANDFNPNFNLSATHKVSPRLTLSLAAYFTYQQQPDFTNHFIGIDRRSGNYVFSNDKLSAAYVWTPRFSTITSWNFVVINYDDPAVGAFQNRTENTLGNEFRFLLLPTTSIIGEYRFEFITYETPTSQSRDSITNYFLAGFDHSFSPRLNLSVRGGVSVRGYDGADDVRLDPYGQASLNYTAGPHLTLGWTLNYSLEEPDVVGTPARTSLQTGLTASYKITPRIVANLSVFYEHDENDGQQTFFFIIPGFADDLLSLSATARYTINRNWGLELGYEFTGVTSGQPFRDYDKTRFYGGANFQF
jgi:hypothetical protein